MKYSVMLTSLYGGDGGKRITYYATGDGSRSKYCDAMLSAEASSKYILANHKIDEIIVLGSNTTYDAGDELVPMVLTDGKSFYASDIRTLSNYSLLRYRLAQFVDEIRIEDQDLRALLPEDEQKQVIAFLKSFFTKAGHDRIGRFNRFFDVLVQDAKLRKEVIRGLSKSVKGYKSNPDAYGQWISYYLYSELKDTSKLELLEGNEDVRVRFIPTDDTGSLSFASRLFEIFHSLEESAGEPIDLDLYINIHSENTYDTLTLMNFMDIVKAIPETNVNIVQVATTSHAPGAVADTISDDTALYGIADLLAGTRAFLKYGKTDLLMEHWEANKVDNPYIEKVLYAMRTIDVGISLCDIGDIELGIQRLRELLNQQEGKLGTSIIERYFAIILEGIRRDYGRLLETETPSFIDLVRWTFRKGFWQQTLTLVEARAPKDFVDNGIYYYCDSEETKEKVIRILGQIYYDLKPFEKYKIYKLQHYFVKFYGRWRVPRNNSNAVHQKQYAKLRMADLDLVDDEIMQAFTRCTDREALHELLHAYYHLGDVRNITNHASEEEDEFVGIREESDVSIRMDMIDQAVEYFIACYEKVVENLDDTDKPVIQVDIEEIIAYSKTLRPQRFQPKK